MESSDSEKENKTRLIRAFLLPTLRLMAIGAVGCIIAGLVACRHTSAGNGADTTSAAPEDFHADNDIAMTVRSIVDAVRVGQPLDSTEYNFIGVLTDGSGRPLYTDSEGLPGEWEIDVSSATSAAIRNLHPGDLLSDDLMLYLADNLNLSEANLVATDEYDDDSETDVTVYDFGGGYLRFETRLAPTTNGIQSPLMNIVITTTPPPAPSKCTPS